MLIFYLKMRYRILDWVVYIIKLSFERVFLSTKEEISDKFSGRESKNFMCQIKILTVFRKFFLIKISKSNLKSADLGSILGQKAGKRAKKAF